MKFSDQKKLMVQNQIEGRGIRSEAVIQAFLKVDRHLFVPEAIRYLAYQDSPLSIGEGQTISQPYIVALMLDLLDPHPWERVLEIGTGSGYQTALLAELFERVYTVERIDVLLTRARSRLQDLGYNNIFFKTGDGTRGWESGEPACQLFDKIIVAAAAPDIPASLIRQLADPGILVIPAGSRYMQDLIVLKKEKNKLTTTNQGGCAFVPLIGSEGWQSD